MKSKRNSLAGTKRGKSKSAKYLQNNPEARAKKKAYDKEYHSSEERKKYRAELNRANRKSKNSKPKDGKDMSHKKNGKMSLESQSSNRKRNGKNGKSSKK